MNVTVVDGNNAGLNARVATFAWSTVVELIGRPHLDVFNQERLIFLKFDLHMKLMPFPNNIVCKSTAPLSRCLAGNLHVGYSKRQSYYLHQEAYQHGLWRNYGSFVEQNMRHYLSCVQMKHLSIPANQTSITFDNVFTGALMDLIIVGLVNDADLSGD